MIFHYQFTIGIEMVGDLINNLSIYGMFLGIRLYISYLFSGSALRLRESEHRQDVFINKNVVRLELKKVTFIII